MPKFTFQDTEQRTFEIVPEGDYKLEIVGFESKLSAGSKTKGLEQLVIEIGLVDNPSAIMLEWVTLPDESTEKGLARALQGAADSMLRALNFSASLKKGQEIELSEETMLGLRGWGHIVIETRQVQVKEDGKQVIENGKPKFEERKSNKVHYWIGNKEKLARNVLTPTPATEPSTETSDPGW